MAPCNGIHLKIFTMQMKWAYIIICFPAEHPELKMICANGRKERQLTVLLCTNMDGSDTLKPSVIRKSQRPCCFKGNKILP
jgi:hypothetical protein